MKPPLLDRYVELLREQFNSGVVYGDRRLMWDTVILRKCQELARYLLGKSATFDLASPRPVLDRSDSRELREKILALSQSEAYKLGIGKSTLHYLRTKAGNGHSFRIYRKVLERIRSEHTSGMLHPSEHSRAKSTVTDTVS
jgi:hypothetical protein